MPIRTYKSDEVCPNCGCNIYDNLANHVYSEGGRDFEIKCPNCETMLEIEVEPVPAFAIKKVAVEYGVQADGAICPDCHEPLVSGMCPALHALQDTPRR